MSDKCSFSDLAKCSECSSDIYSLMKHDNDSVINILSEVGIVLNDYSNTCSSYTICSTHFNNLSKINANRRRRKFCEVPSLISAHQLPGKVSRYLNHQGAQRIKQGWGVTLPVNSGKLYISTFPGCN